MDAMALDFVSLQVQDLDASCRFYTELLGFQAQPQGRPDAVVFEDGGGAIFAIRTPLVDLDAVERRGLGHRPVVRRAGHRGAVCPRPGGRDPHPPANPGRPLRASVHPG